MNRRKLLGLAAGASAAHLLRPVRALAASTEAIRITVPAEPGPRMPLNFTGLSYESGQLYNPQFFAPSNAPLIESFRNLNPTGVLRLGGHLSNITPWEGVGQNEPKQQAGVRHGIEDYWEWPLVDPTIQASKRGMITRKAIENLRGFLDAVDWRLMYTLNFAAGSPERAADEAEFVSRTMGPRLLAFILGNEVDGYAEDRFFRDANYGIDQYLAEWKTWTAAVRARVPHAPFAGPDTEKHIDTWVRRFAEATRGQVELITSHYYGMGPASDPAMTTERLLRKENPELEREIAGAHAASAAAGGTPYRMDEGNSCFGGGRAGVSDAYASALWAADYMLRAAAAGFAGVNLHGGGTGVYTPIETSAADPAKPRPVYFGMQLAQQFSGLRVSECRLTTHENVSAYAGAPGDAARLAVINKGPVPVRVSIPAGYAHRRDLTGPSLAAKSGVSFGPSALKPGGVVQEIPAYSAALFERTSGA